MVFHTAGYGVTMDTLASTAANFMGGVRPEIAAFALAGGGKKRRGRSTKRSKSRRSSAKRKGRRSSTRRVGRRSSTRRVGRRSSTRRKGRRSSTRRVGRRSPSRSKRSPARRTTRRPDVRRKPDVQRLPKGDRQKRLKERLSDRRVRRSIIKDIESGKSEQARKKMKTLSIDPSRQSSMDSFLAGIESGSMPSSNTLRLSDMSDESVKSKKVTTGQFESARKKLKKAITQ